MLQLPRKKAIILKNIKTNEEWEYGSLTDLGKALGISKSTVSLALINNRLIKKTYTITHKPLA